MKKVTLDDVKKEAKRLSKLANETGIKGKKKTEEFLQSKEGKALVKVVVTTLPIILSAVPQTRKIKTVRKIISKLF